MKSDTEALVVSIFAGFVVFALLFMSADLASTRKERDLYKSQYEQCRSDYQTCWEMLDRQLKTNRILSNKLGGNKF